MVSIPEKILVLLTALFTMLVVLSNLVAPKFVHINLLSIYETNLSAGTILYPFTFIITDLIAEFYGRSRARVCVNSAIITSICTAALILFVEHLDAVAWSTINNQDFNKAFGHYSTVILASLVASYVSQNIDIYLYLKIRQLTQGRFVWLRSSVSTLASLFIDTSIVLCFMAVHGSIPYNHIPEIIWNTGAFKLCFILLSTPLFYLMRYIISSLLAPNPEAKYFEV